MEDEVTAGDVSEAAGAASPTPVIRPSGSLHAEIRREAENVHEAATYSSETQFEYAKRWRRVDRWLGSAAAAFAAVAGVGGLSNVFSARWAGLVAVLAALTAAVAASISAPKTKEKASVAANSYRALQQDVRIFLRIDLDSMPDEDARQKLQELVDRLQQLNREAEIPSKRAWEKARHQIESGAQTYEADRQMPLTTAQAFVAFVDKISPTDAQRTEITNKREATEKYLRAAFPPSSNLPLTRVILIGSAARGTIVRPINDIDVMAEFINKAGVFEQYRKDSSLFLQRIRSALDAKTSIGRIGARGQAVRLFYQSGAHVDIAPVFKWSGGGFGLPRGDGYWMTTDPEAQAVWYSGRRTAVGANLTPFAKLVRRWNAVHSHRFESFHLEVMVASMFKTLGTNYRDALKCFFEWAPGRITVADPAGHSGNLDDYLTRDDRTAISQRFAEALDRSKRAIAAEAQGNHTEAKRLWRIELGDEFPG